MRQLFHHVNLKRIIHSRYYDLVIADVLKSFAFSMISLFIPLFLIEKSFALHEVLFFYLAFYIVSVLSHYFLIKTISKVGIKRGLIISYIAEIFVYLVLYNYDSIAPFFGLYNYLIILFIPFTMSSIFYWTSHHAYFFVSSHSHNEGEKLGKLYSIPNLLGILAPFTGGALITFLGFKYTYAIGIVLIVLASFVLSFSRKIEADIRIDLKKVFDLGRDEKNWIYFIDGANYFATGLVWPLYMFFMSINFLSMGVIYFFCNIAYSLSCYLGGKMSDRIGVRRLGRIGAVGHSISLLMRAFSLNVFSMSVSLATGGVFGGFMQISLDAGFFKHSHANIGDSMMNRELYMHLGRIFLLLILMSAAYLADIRFALVLNLIIAAFLTFILNFFIKKDRAIID